jgi:hypothetical protein
VISSQFAKVTAAAIGAHPNRNIATAISLLSARVLD